MICKKKVYHYTKEGINFILLVKTWFGLFHTFSLEGTKITVFDIIKDCLGYYVAWRKSLHELQEMTKLLQIKTKQCNEFVKDCQKQVVKNERLANKAMSLLAERDELMDIVQKHKLQKEIKTISLKDTLNIKKTVPSADYNFSSIESAAEFCGKSKYAINKAIKNGKLKKPLTPAKITKWVKSLEM